MPVQVALAARYASACTAINQRNIMMAKERAECSSALGSLKSALVHLEHRKVASLLQ